MQKIKLYFWQKEVYSKLTPLDQRKYLIEIQNRRNFWRKIFGMKEVDFGVVLEPKLTSEYSNVKMCTNIVPKDKIKCEAKLDEDGMILCKIHLDFECKLTSEEFLQYFDTP